MGREKKVWLNVGMSQLVCYSRITGAPTARTGALVPKTVQQLLNRPTTPSAAPHLNRGGQTPLQPQNFS